MQLLILITLCLRMVQGPPPWLRSFHLKKFPQAVPSESFSTTCQNVHNHTSSALGGSLCMSMEVSGHSLVDSAAVQLLVRGPDKQCEHGGICSMKVGSQVQAEVSLSAAPPSLGLSLTLCSLSASSNPFNQSHIPLLVNDCPYSAGVTFTLVTPKPCIKTPPRKSFSFQLDHFYNSSIQFLHCRVELCLQGTQCDTSTGVTKLPQCRIPGVPCTLFSASPSFLKPVFHRTVTQPLLVTISASSRNPLQSLPGYKRSPLSTGREYSVQEVGVVAVIGVTLCSFFLGMMLTIGLWCIHKKTVPTSQGTQSS